MLPCIAYKNISIGDYDALYLAGGHGTCSDFVDNKELDAVIASAYYSKCIVAADCHGPVGICGAKKVAHQDSEDASQ